MSWMSLQKNQSNELLYVGYNQDNGCFACGTDTGFRIYNCDPFKETFQRDFSMGGIGYVEMLFRCNILALVGGGRNPRYPPNKVMIWDDHQNRCIGELSFKSEVRAVKLRRDRVLVVLSKKIYVYNFADLKLVDHIETFQNDQGLCSLCPYSNNTVVACPGLSAGTVRVQLYDQNNKTQLINAHETALACIALNFDGTRLATASEKGTLIRIWDTSSGKLVQEVRRGANPALIYSIAFNHNSQWLACSSDKGTVHVYGLQVSDEAKKKGDDGKNNGSSAQEIIKGPSQSGGAHEQEDIESKRDAGSAAQEEKKDANQVKANPVSIFSPFQSLLPKYFSSQWSFAQFRVGDTRTVVAFGSEKNTLIIVAADGTFYKASYDPTKPGAECIESFHANFLKSSSNGIAK
jgi:hypothetical protein